jgi:hypothetical protein
MITNLVSFAMYLITTNSIVALASQHAIVSVDVYSPVSTGVCHARPRLNTPTQELVTLVNKHLLVFLVRCD